MKEYKDNANTNANINTNTKAYKEDKEEKEEKLDKESSSKGLALIDVDNEKHFETNITSPTNLDNKNENKRFNNTSYVFKTDEYISNITNINENNESKFFLENIEMEKEKIKIEKDKLELSLGNVKLESEIKTNKINSLEKEKITLEKVNKELKEKINNFDNLIDINKKLKEEAELISSMVLGLGFQILNTNNEKKNINNKSWLDIERNKNFP